MSVIAYIYQNNPKAVIDLANEYRVPFQTEQDLIANMHQKFMSQDEEFLAELAEIHPDRDLILFGESVKDENGEEKKSNCCGSSFSGADGEETEKKEETPVKKDEAKTASNNNTLLYVAVGGFGLLTLVAIVALAGKK